MQNLNCFIASVILACTLSCKRKLAEPHPISDKFRIEILDPEARNVIDKNAEIKVESEGYNWVEGPLWIESEKWLLFSDIPENKVFKLDQSGDVSPYLHQSGYTGLLPQSSHDGSNGLKLNNNNELVLMQHGDRRIAKMNAELAEPKSDFITLVDSYDGKRLNSPNDGIFDSLGNLYFTDPPYGLKYTTEFVGKELSFQGVYCLKTNGELILLDSLSRPNGITLSPDETQLYVAVSDPEHAVWYQYDVLEPGKIANRSIFYDVTDWVTRKEFKGLPDGMKCNRSAYIFATGPGGVWIFNKEAKPVAIIYTGQATSNCVFGTDEKKLYITADDYVLSVKLK